MRFTFVHAADLHLDTPFQGIGQVSPEVAELLRDASLDAFDALVDHTLQAGASFLLLAGDIYDGAERGLRAQLRFVKGLEKLAERGVPVFICHGNHDPLGGASPNAAPLSADPLGGGLAQKGSGWSAVRSWPENVTIFGADQVRRIAVEQAGSAIAQVYGISYGRRDVTENLALRFSREEGEGLHVAMLHANVGANAEHAAYSPCSLDDLRDRGMDYWALGHVHSRRVLHEGEPWVVYPGNTQGRSFKPSEQGGKGAYLVEADGNRVRGLSFLQTERLRFRREGLDVSRFDDLADLRRGLTEFAAAAGADCGAAGLILDVRLEGTGPVHADLACSGGVAEVLRDLRQEFEGERPLVWWERVQDRTSPPVDLDAVRARGDLASEICALVDHKLERPELAEGFLDDLIYPDKPYALKRHLEELTSDQESELLERARLRAIELLDQADACE